MTSEGKHEPPKAGGGDAAHAIVKAGLSSIPVAGSAAAELFTWLVTPPLERRRQAWMENVGAALRALEDGRRIDLHDLQNDDAFIDTVMSASQAAIRTANETKREALRNAVLNSALPGRPDDATRHTFVSLVDQFTEWHIRILKFFQGPSDWAEKHGVSLSNLMMGSPASVLEDAIPELSGRRHFYDQIWADLSQRGLTTTNSLGSMMSGSGTIAKRTSELGDDFLNFIESPALEE